MLRITLAVTEVSPGEPFAAIAVTLSLRKAVVRPSGDSELFNNSQPHTSHVKLFDLSYPFAICVILNSSKTCVSLANAS